MRFVFFDVQNRIYGRKTLLKDFLHPVNKQPVYITERITQRDSELLDLSRGLGMYTVTNNCAPKVFVSIADGEFQSHKLVNMKDADQIFKYKNPTMARQANDVRIKILEYYKIFKTTFLALLLPVSLEHIVIKLCFVDHSSLNV